MTDSAWSLALFSLSLATWHSFRSYLKFKHYEDAYVTERRGRIRVEREMKNIREVRLQTGKQSGGAFFVQPIAHVESCYKQCIGTPRQGRLVPSSRSIIHLKPCMSPEALDGLEGFSHVWLSFKFHLNTNTLDEAKAFQGVEGSNQKFTFTAKITPPMLKRKVGVLSTRSPHRPNPIGITLARIERVDKKRRCLHVTACDLVQDTPILDIKPYVSSYDAIESDRVPDWISSTVDTRNDVTVAPGLVQESADMVAKHARLYKKDSELFWKGVIETLEADVRSKFQTKKAMQGAEKRQVFELPFDTFNVRYVWSDDRSIEIIDINREGSKKAETAQTVGDSACIDEELQTCRVAKRFQNTE
eukprot:CAMPEP_0114425518 /NCGR_PEP_ID=MMETSP0103-20121206/7278_1 /TAXON_ID=37642 ORGANISM="Paraphysomonas imperforata, Strain PA2" /NCGR_SAMPLE_ID=MMETSP0103 /ASSEMBLY_ACC=CAM_ASM_000201 /LENGTH=358 /DNA_ID=CAMNT_0001594359 /DNA_START=6 /DNA_END=1082 /DNA_ORIENTATION=+